MDVHEELLRGPRGRRWCLNCVSDVDEAVASSLFWLARERDPHPGTLLRFGSGEPDTHDDPSFTDLEVADAIGRADVGAVTPAIARAALASSVDIARYWQEPDGTDIVAALPSVRASLSTAARRLVALSPELTASAAVHQWTAQWCPVSESAPIERSAAQILERWSDEQHEDERRSLRERPTDPRANWSGTWWSVPQQLLTSRGSPLAALDMVEDPMGWTVATVIPIAGRGEVLEIRSAKDWAQLCRGYPMEVTASRRHDWFRVTGRDGRWLIPDWERVAQRWDAVHLTTLGYLSAATALIPIDEDYASVIAGWGPDSTIWLTDSARETDGPRDQWERAVISAEWTPSSSV
ncbi:hypothetical protein QE374_001524 [Microbacterium sp. SORGH_AS428]|uniref:hypothetical protein n=1 Tax=Microbacterium sp. SORGH_AS_0428 TaxID=3041788 RepID=UPI00285CBBD8|nr:hypothetical protein [Microbacterium sp. SORGH_AS_0428]MDR6199615.1 hypothetical protein [Microbacterium sp. SORGH_AS_0428]